MYRHSKWLAFMERRLLVAKSLLNPESSALVCAIDEKEYLNLGLLLKQTFPEARIQMVSSVINAKGVIRYNEFSRTNEFLFFVFLGNHRITPEQKQVKNNAVRWASLRRSDDESARGTAKGGPEQFYPIYVSEQTGKIESFGIPLKPEDDVSSVPDIPGCVTVLPVRDKGDVAKGGPEQFYPIYVSEQTGKIESFGIPLKPEDDVSSVPDIPGCVTVLPVRDKGDVTEMNWGLTISTVKKRLQKGYVKAVISGKRKKKITIYYLTSGQIDDIEKGNIVVEGFDDAGAAKVAYEDGKPSNPTTQWVKDSHNAQSHGSDVLRELIPAREFPYPKSIYAVEDVLRIVVGEKLNAIVLDYFAGSGTTAHAVMRLNRQDGGCRQCISVTNNEVAADEQVALRKKGLRSGDEDWEKWGICEYITKPRIKAAITGKTPDGDSIKNCYQFADEFPMAEGFDENVEFFALTYETPVAVNHNRAFARIAPLLWMRAGCEGRRIADVPERGWDVADTYGLLVDLDQSVPFSETVENKDTIRIAYIVTDDDRRFQSVARRLPDAVESVRLYESYLTNFRFSIGRQNR